MCSNSLQHIEVKEIGRKFSGSALSPFLNIGVTLAVNQSSGKSPVLLQ